jgi:hypothetical protein
MWCSCAKRLRLDEGACAPWPCRGMVGTFGPRRFTLHTPGGFGTSKLAEKLPRLLPCPMTARNLRTIAALVEMRLFAQVVRDFA